MHHLQSNPFAVSPQYSVNPPTRPTNSYPAWQIFTCYRVSPATLPDFGVPRVSLYAGLTVLEETEISLSNPSWLRQKEELKYSPLECVIISAEAFHHVNRTVPKISYNFSFSCTASFFYFNFWVSFEVNKKFSIFKLNNFEWVKLYMKKLAMDNRAALHVHRKNVLNKTRNFSFESLSTSHLWQATHRHSQAAIALLWCG